MISGEVGLVDFPTLAHLQDAWITQHCRVPDGFARGRPMKLADWQFWVLANRYRVREDAVFVDPELVGELLEAIADGEVNDEITNEDLPLLNQAFQYRMTLVVGAQKTGKGPGTATFVALEAAGPTVFADWAVAGDVYRCEDNGCDCGWEYAYLPGEPMGMRHPSPLIQITATSEDQADNIYRPLKAMIQLGPLRELLAVREGFIRVLGLSEDEDLDRIDVVTAAANSRLGNPISDAEQDELGLWLESNKMMNVADVQRRGAAGMGGRTHGTTNAWNPAEDSYAQRIYEANADDVWIYYRNPDLEPSLLDNEGKPLSFGNKKYRRKILAWVYEGSWWVNLDSVEAEAASIMKTDPAQAERFFANRLVKGAGAWLAPGTWQRAYDGTVVPKKPILWLPNPAPRTPVCGGFDGSESDDWTGIRLETRDGKLFTPRWQATGQPMIWNPAQHGGRIPRSQVHEAWQELHERYALKRVYCDPGFNDEFDPTSWKTEIETWARLYGDEVFVPWQMGGNSRTRAVHTALVRFEADLLQRSFRHDGCPVTAKHCDNARKIPKPGGRYILGKPSQTQKIDLAVTSVLAHEAACDARADGWAESDLPALVFGM